MSRQVWKFPIGAAVQGLQMPVAGKPLHVGLDPEGIACVWMEIESEANRVSRRFHVAGTGWNIPSPSEYVGSWKEGPFMWHLFDLGESP
jgi:hypothetical protein